MYPLFKAFHSEHSSKPSFPLPKYVRLSPQVPPKLLPTARELPEMIFDTILAYSIFVV
jgi:hypothetical protein